jgi:hypothetical protein
MSYASATRRAPSRVEGGGLDAVDGTRVRERWFREPMFGVCRPTRPGSKVWLGAVLWFLSHDMNTQLDHINDLLERDSELRDVCDPHSSRVPSYQNTENQG